MAGRGLPLTVTELAALGLTVVLARQLGSALDAFQAAVSQLMLRRLHQPPPFETGQSAIYREIRRARLHQRPLALFVAGATPRSLEQSAERFLAEAQRAAAADYTAARVADLLSRELKDCALLTQRGDHFIVVLPETGPEEAADLAAKLREATRHMMNLELAVGWATFPDQEVTLDQLLEQATARMRSGSAPDGRARPENEPGLIDQRPASAEAV